MKNDAGGEGRRFALITGASEGIGLELARVMAADGWGLALVARRAPLLEELAEVLKGSRGLSDQDVILIPVDLSTPSAPQEIFNRLQGEGIAVDALVNNAGFGSYGGFAGQDLGTLERMVAVNAAAIVRLTRLFLPGMVGRRRGWIMNVASTAAFQAVPLNAVYGATKAFVLSFSEALAAELEGSGVSVTCLCPGVTRTGFQRAAGGHEAKPDFRGVMTAEEVARRGYKALMEGGQIVVTGLVNRLLVQATRLAPRKWAIRTALKMMRRRLTTDFQAKRNDYV